MTKVKIWELPATWEETVLANLVSPKGVFSDGDWIESKDQDPEGGVRLVQLADIGEMQFLDKSRRYLTERKAHDLKCTFLQKEDLLISRLGDPLGKACMYPGNEPLAVTAVDVCILRPGNSYIEPRLIGYFLNSPQIRQSIDSQSSGTTRKRITGKKLKELPFRLPPLNEQHRIVEKIETLFARIDKGEDALREVQKLLKRYRQSILKAAVTGELTRDWREANQHRLEPASDLLARILEARRENWQGGGKYKEPTAPESTQFTELPGFWALSTTEQLAFVETGATPKKSESSYYSSKATPWITSTAVNEDPIQTPQAHITEKALRETNAKVFPIGALIVAMYGEGKTRGKVSELGIDAASNQACAALLIQHLPPDVARYLKLFYLYNYEAIRRQSAGGVQPNLNLSIIKDTQVSLPSEVEIGEILARVNSELDRINELDLICSNELRRSAALRQSILKSAFTGQLVPQDPNDEPASELLARIRAERKTAPTKTRPKKKVGKKSRAKA